jgi:hypothetical protein
MKIVYWNKYTKEAKLLGNPNSLEDINDILMAEFPDVNKAFQDGVFYVEVSGKPVAYSGNMNQFASFVRSLSAPQLPQP